MARKTLERLAPCQFQSAIQRAGFNKERSRQLWTRGTQGNVLFCMNLLKYFKLGPALDTLDN